MYNRRYDKKFLMLRQEVVGYSMGQKTPWGSCTIEIKNNKGTMQVRVQGLRNVPKQTYDVYMIGGQKRSIFCNTLMLDQKGQGEFIYTFSPDGIGSHGVAIEDIHTIAVVVEDGRVNHIVAPLVAYVDEKTEWKAYFQKTKPSKIQQVFIENEFESPKITNLNHETNQKPKEKNYDTQLQSIQITSSLSNQENNKILLSFPVDNSLKSPYSKKQITKISTNEATSTTSHASPSVITNTKIDTTNDIKVAEYTEISTPQPFLTMPWERKVFQEESPETYHGSFRGLIEKFRNELTQLENEGVFTKKDIETIQNAGADVDNSVDIHGIDVDTVDKNVGISVDNSFPPVDKTVDTVDKNKGNSVLPKRFSAQKERRLFRNHLKVQPFSTTPKTVWTCITLDELLYIKEIPIAWQRDLFFLYPMKKYGHILYNEDDGQLMIAVPIEKQEYSFFEKEANLHAFHDFLEVDESDMGYFVRSIE